MDDLEDDGSPTGCVTLPLILTVIAFWVGVYLLVSRLF